MRRTLLPLAALLALIAGCGGDDGASTDAETTPPATEETTPTTSGTEPAGDKLADGRKLFVDSSCASCHRLADADAEGVSGPSLDQRKPDAEEAADQIRSGGGGMPGYEGRLTTEQIQTLADYIAEVAGS